MNTVSDIPRATPSSRPHARADSKPARRGHLATLARRMPVDLEIIVPAFNEQQRLPSTLEQTVGYLADRPWRASVIVVDNGSVDRTAEIVQRFSDSPVRVQLLGCATRGKGAAVRRGVLTGTSRFVGFMDADLATPISTLDTMLPILSAGTVAVIASRHAPGAELTVEQGASRRLGGRVFRAIAQRAVPGLADTQCGFKFFEGTVARSVFQKCVVDGFAFDVEVLARIMNLGHTVVEVPVQWSDREGSTFSARRDGLRSMVDMLRVREQLRASAA